MNQGLPPSPDPDPRRLSLESLEAKLHALPLAAVPEALSSKLVAAIPPTKAIGSLASRVIRRWPWIAAVGVMCCIVSAVFYSWLMYWNSPPTGSNENRGATDSSTTGNDVPGSSKAVQDYELAVRFDPYNADAWFSLA